MIVFIYHYSFYHFLDFAGAGGGSGGIMPGGGGAGILSGGGGSGGIMPGGGGAGILSGGGGPGIIDSHSGGKLFPAERIIKHSRTTEHHFGDHRPHGNASP